MRRFLGLMLFLTLSVAGLVHAGNDPMNVQVDSTGLGKSSARITWDTAAPTRSRILYGRTNAYGAISSVDLVNRAGETHHSWYLSGLAPGTVYHFCPQNGDDVAPSDTTPVHASVCNGQQNDFTLTTLPDDHRSDPSAPLQFVDTSMPAVTGSTFQVKSDCSDFLVQVQAAAAANGTLTHQVLIPAGTVCDGAFVFPVKSPGNGWIIIRTATPDAQLPGETVRVTPNHLPLLATLRNTHLQPFSSTRAHVPACTVGQWIWEDYVISDPAGLPLYYCSAPNTWVKPTFTTGTRAQMPSSCTPGSTAGGLWYVQTDAPALSSDPHRENRAWWCLNDNGVNHFVNMNMSNNGSISNAAVVQIPAGAHHYRFVGLEFETLKTPTAYMPVLQTPNLVAVDPAAHHIIFDRTYIHGQDYPNRLNWGMWLDGTHVAVINSFIDKVHVWKDPSRFGQDVEEIGTAINIQNGPGPAKIVNNFISAIGITVFIPEGYPAPSDIEIRGNHIYKDARYQYGSPTSDGRFYFNRHALELKSGQRFLIDGNIFDGNWSVVNLAFLLLLSPRSSPDLPTNNTQQISDMMITNNIFRRAPGGIGITGHEDRPQGLGQGLVTARVRVTNNVFRDMGPLRTTPNFYANFIEGKAIGVSWQPEDLTITHNTWYNNKDQSGADAKIITFYDGTAPTSNLIFKDNAGVLGQGVEGNGGLGTATLNTYWQRVPDPAWAFDHNLFAGPFTSANNSSAYPAGNVWASSESDIGYSAPASGDFTMTNGAYKNKASDGTDPGVNMTALQAATLHVLDGGGTSVYVPPPPITPPITSTTLTPTLLTPRIYPNPWRADKHTGSITFDNVSAGTTVKIFTLSGHWVRELTASGSSVPWDRKNNKGDIVASGIYVYLVEDAQGNQAKGKLALIK